ncbi:Phage integrase family protein [Chitinophaga sancti]|nr:Phage integrase family protein [Chitinophaga sancti]
MIHRTDGCRYSELNFFPSNWKTTTSSSSLKKIWRIEYTFYDPSMKDRYPNGKAVTIKGGINRAKDLSSRRQLMQYLIDVELDLLENQFYNPITKTILEKEAEKSREGVIDENTPFIKALELALESKVMDGEAKKDIKNKIPHIEKAARNIKYKGAVVADMPISSISRKLIRLVLDEIGNNKGDRWTANNFNRYRTDLRTIFIELNELEAMESNPMDGIRKRKGIKKQRETLTSEDRKRVDNHLRENHYTFWRFARIFFHSGCRERELLGVTIENVNLKERWFKVMVKKDKESRWDKKAIEPGAYNLWKEVIAEADKLLLENRNNPNLSKSCVPGGKPGNLLFIFSEALKPMFRGGPIRQEQICRRWNNYVKRQLGITADFYSLKHSRTSEDINSEVRKAIRIATKKAARKNGHTSTKMVEQIYDTQSKDRLLKIKTKSKAHFAPEA